LHAWGEEGEGGEGRKGDFNPLKGKNGAQQMSLWQVRPNPRAACRGPFPTQRERKGGGVPSVYLDPADNLAVHSHLIRKGGKILFLTEKAFPIFLIPQREEREKEYY